MADADTVRRLLEAIRHHRSEKVKVGGNYNWDDDDRDLWAVVDDFPAAPEGAPSAWGEAPGAAGVGCHTDPVQSEVAQRDGNPLGRGQSLDERNRHG